MSSARVGIVVHRQDLGAGEIDGAEVDRVLRREQQFLSPSAAARAVHGGERKQHPKGSTTALPCALRVHGSAVELHELLDDGETQTQAPLGTRR